MPATPDQVLEILIGMAPEIVKARFRALILSQASPDAPPSKDRPRLLAEAAERIAAIEREHTELVDFAAGLEPPIKFEYLPAVRDRRQLEADEARRQAAATAERRAVEQAVDALPEAPGGARSAYLDAGRAARAEVRGA